MLKLIYDRPLTSLAIAWIATDCIVEILETANARPWITINTGSSEKKRIPHKKKKVGKK